MNFVFHTRGEAHEPPHVHVYKGKGPTRSKVKIWLKDLEPDKKRIKGFSLKDVRKILNFLEPLQATLLADWEKEIATIGK